MSNKHHKPHYPYCLNCHYPLSEFDKNCSQCGQKPTDGKTTMHDLLHEFIHTLFHLDGKFFWTLKHLFVPGKLTTEFFKGHHKRYAHPIQLFLVLGALAFGVLAAKGLLIEEKIKTSIDKDKNQVVRTQFLMELDSVSRALLPLYASKNEASKLRDSLILKMKYSGGVKEEEKGIRNQIDAVFKKEFRASKILSRLVDSDSVKYRLFSDSLMQVLMLENSDSILTIEKKRLDSITGGNPVKAFTEGMKEGMDKAKNDDRIVKTEEEKKRVQSALEDLNEGFKDAQTQSLIRKLRPLIVKLKQTLNIKQTVKIEEDSTNLFSFNFVGDNEKKGNKAYNIPTSEMYELTPDSIISKYKITGFIEKMQVKQTLKVQSQGNDLAHYILGKMLWITLAQIPILALFFLLIYRRSKRLYVEHFVFLMHFNSTLFVGIVAATWVNSYWRGSILCLIILALIHFFLALKFYYNQSWGKTLLKFFIIASFFFILAFFFTLLAVFVGFLIF